MGLAGWSGSVYLASRATPTISNVLAYRELSMPKCLPRGSSLGKYFLTSDSFTIATGREELESLSAKSRPRAGLGTAPLGCPAVSSAAALRHREGRGLLRAEPLPDRNAKRATRRQRETSRR